MTQTVANGQRLGTRALALLGAVLVSLASLVVLAPGASAHSVLLSSVPADGASLGTAPSVVVLTFTEPIQSSSMQFAVTASSGQSVTTEKATVAGTVITQKLPKSLPNDDYTVAYRVISVDGHPVSAELTFSVNDPSATAEPLGLNNQRYQVGGSTKVASGETALYAKILYPVVPLLILFLLVGLIKTRGRYRDRNPRDEGDGMSNPFVLARADAADRVELKEHIHTRPDIIRDREDD
jgi:methionine-rich copper-binding protein CopC